MLTNKVPLEVSFVLENIHFLIKKERPLFNDDFIIFFKTLSLEQRLSKLIEQPFCYKKSLNAGLFALTIYNQKIIHQYKQKRVLGGQKKAAKYHEIKTFALSSFHTLKEKHTLLSRSAIENLVLRKIENDFKGENPLTRTNQAETIRKWIKETT